MSVALHDSRDLNFPLDVIFVQMIPHPILPLPILMHTPRSSFRCIPILLYTQKDDSDHLRLSESRGDAGEPACYPSGSATGPNLWPKGVLVFLLPASALLPSPFPPSRLRALRLFRPFLLPSSS